MDRDVNGMNIQELRNEMAEVRAKAQRAIAEMGPNLDPSLITSLEGDAASKMTQIRGMNDRLDSLAAAIEAKTAIERAGKRMADSAQADPAAGFRPTEGKREGDGEFKSLGERIVGLGLAELKGATGHGLEVGFDPFEFKTTMTTSAGWAPESVRSGRVVLSAQGGAPRLLDLVPIIPINQASDVYMEETTFTNNAVEKTEVAAAGEAALALAQRTVTIERLPVFLPVSDVQLEDEPGARAYIDARLPFMLRKRLESQMIAGDGVSPNIKGYFNVSGIQSQAMGADPVFDAIFKAMTKIEVTGDADPEAVAMHPNDWQNIRLQRTVDGIYILGNPDATADKRLFGLPVVTSTAVTENTALVGAFGGYSALRMRSGIEVKISDSHDDYFVKGIQAIRATMRVALSVYRGAAFCKVTGLEAAA